MSTVWLWAANAYPVRLCARWHQTPDGFAQQCRQPLHVVHTGLLHAEYRCGSPRCPGFSEQVSKRGQR